MLYLLDTANVKEIEKAAEVFPLAGVTTNPSIIAQEKRSFFTILKEIRAIIGDRMLHAQVLGETCEDIIRDAETLQEKIGGNLYIKVPVSIEGYKAMPKLKQMGMKVTATAIYTPGQALLAAQAGVDFTAPYLNRIDNISGMGGFIAWLGIAVSHYRFRRGFLHQGGDPQKLPYRSAFFPWGPVFAFAVCLAITLGQNYQAFLADSIQWDSIAATYIGIPLFLALWLGYRWVHKTHFVGYDEMQFPEHMLTRKRQSRPEAA